MKIQPAAHVRWISGKQGDLVFLHTKTGTFARSAGRQCRHASAEQLLVRRFVGEAARQWKQLNGYQRYAWSQYARDYFHTSNVGRTVTPNGASIFAKAALNRQALGLPINLAVPSDGRPDDVLNFVQIPGLDEHSLGLRLHITEIPVDPTEYALAVRITRPILDRFYEPDRRAYRYCCGFGTASMRQFPAEGGDFVFPGLQWPIPAGSWFGIELRRVRIADGISGTARASVCRKE